MIIDPYLVIGTGRCGTSTVARILHERLNICMGESFIPSDEYGSQGYYEDVKFVELNRSLVIGGCNIQEWEPAFRQTIAERQARQIPWGVKNVRIADILGLYLSFFDDPKLILCHRRAEDVIASHKRCYNCTHRNAAATYWTRTIIIQRLLRGRDFLPFNFTERLDEKYIESCIREKWNL